MSFDRPSAFENLYDEGTDLELDENKNVDEQEELKEGRIPDLETISFTDPDTGKVRTGGEIRFYQDGRYNVYFGDTDREEWVDAAELEKQNPESVEKTPTEGKNPVQGDDEAKQIKKLSEEGEPGTSDEEEVVLDLEGAVEVLQEIWKTTEVHTKKDLIAHLKEMLEIAQQIVESKATQIKKLRLKRM